MMVYRLTGLLLIVLTSTLYAENRWSVRLGTHPLTKSKVCLMERPFTISDGSTNLKAVMVVVGRDVIIAVHAKIDKTYSSTGLKVDGRQLVPFSSIASNKATGWDYALFRGMGRELKVHKFERGAFARITIGFWPTWPTTRTHTSAVSLQGFTLSHDEHKECMIRRKNSLAR